MLIDKFELLYDEVYAPKLLPMDLLENLQLDNYSEVNFHNENNSIIAITKCKLPNGDITEFKYTFTDNKLYKLEQVISNDNLFVIYDRVVEISSKIAELGSYSLENVC